MNKDWLHKIIYSSGDVFLPEKNKKYTRNGLDRHK